MHSDNFYLAMIASKPKSIEFEKLKMLIAYDKTVELQM